MTLHGCRTRVRWTRRRGGLGTGARWNGCIDRFEGSWDVSKGCHWMSDSVRLTCVDRACAAMTGLAPRCGTGPGANTEPRHPTTNLHVDEPAQTAARAYIPRPLCHSMNSSGATTPPGFNLANRPNSQRYAVLLPLRYRSLCNLSPRSHSAPARRGPRPEAARTSVQNRRLAEQLDMFCVCGTRPPAACFSAQCRPD